MIMRQKKSKRIEGESLSHGIIPNPDVDSIDSLIEEWSPVVGHQELLEGIIIPCSVDLVLTSPHSNADSIEFFITRSGHEE
jgi:hypothetical protein